MRRFTRYRRCTARLVFTVLMAWAWCDPAGTSLRAQPAAPARPAAEPVPTAAELEKAAAEFERTFAAVEEGWREMSRETFDPQAVIESVGRDPDALFAWVRDRTGWVPYRGMLRGPEGVLMDRVGNSLDRALLLAALLQGAGQRVRVARGGIAKGEAAALAGKLRQAKPPAPAAGAPGDDTVALAERYAARLGVSAGELLADAQRVRLKGQQVAERVVAGTAHQWPLIAKQVGAPPAADASADDAAAALADHWWVQRMRDGAWVDMDPTVPGAVPGAPAGGKAEKFLEPSPVDGRFRPEAADCHRIVVRVVVEQSGGGAPKTGTALEHTLTPAEIYGDDVVLRQVPIQFADAAKVTRAADGTQRLLATGQQATEWLPVLAVGQREVAQSSFTDTGEVNTAPNPDPTGKAGKAVRESFGGLGGALGGGGGNSAPKTALSAVWLEYEIVSPGLPAAKSRRTLYDLLAPERREAGGGETPAPSDAEKLRRGLALLAETEMLPLVCRPSDAFVSHLTSKRVVEKGRVLTKRYRSAAAEMAAGKKWDAAARAATADGAGGGGNAVMTDGLYAFATARHAWSRHAADVYLDRPNLITYRTGVAAGEKDELAFRIGFDIVANDVAVRPGAQGGAFAVRLEQGVLDTNLERWLIEGFGPVENTAARFETAARGGAAWEVVRDASALKGPAVPALSRAAVGDDLKQGYVVLLAPGGTVDANVPAAWWRVHPVTGQTLGRMGAGEGQSMTEKVIKFIVTTLPSLGATGLEQFCKRMRGGSTSGACNPCLAMMLGAFGAVMGFGYGLVGDGLFFILPGLWGAYTAGRRGAACLDKLLGDRMYK